MARGDRWAIRAASWSQLGTLVLLGIGYFFTVRPVFQYQLLQEQNAKLELQNSVAQAQLNATIAQESAAAEKLRALNAALERTSRERRTLESALQTARAREVEARKAAEVSSGKATAQLAALREARTRLLATTVAALQLANNADTDEALILEYWNSYADSYSKDFDGQFIANARNKWPKPYPEILAELEKVGTKDADAAEPLAQLKSRLENAKDRFVCEAVDFDMMRKQFLGELAALEPEIQRGVDAWIAEQKRGGKNPFRYVVIDPASLAIVRSNQRLEKDGKIVSDYWGRLLKLHRACEEKRYGLLLTIMVPEKLPQPNRVMPTSASPAPATAR